jgi:hypothetical protein
MKTIDHASLSQVTGGAGGAVDQTLDALQSKYGGGGWITFNGEPRVKPGASTDIVRGKFKTDPWAAGNPSVDRSFTSSVPHHNGTWDPATISNVHTLKR